MTMKRIWDQIDQVKERTENLSVADLHAEQTADPDLLIVDIRELQERLLTGAIPGAVHVPRGMIEFWADPTLAYFRDFFRPGRRIVLYCAGGGRSVLATHALTEMGYTNVAQLEPGFDGWQQEGGAIEDVAPDSKWVRRA